MKKVIYKILIVIFFILFLQIITNSKVYGVEFDILNKDNQKIDSIECENGDSLTIRFGVHYNKWFNAASADCFGDDTYIKKTGYENVKAEGGYDWICEEYFDTLQAGEGKITITVRTNFAGMGVDEKTKQIPVKIKKAAEEIEIEREQERRKQLEEYCKTNIKDVTTPDNQLLYLRSILFNDKQNNNSVLWNKFVNDTTPEERENWYRNITYNIRDTSPEKQAVLNLLKTQIDVDKNVDGAQEGLDEKIDNAKDAQQDDYDKSKEDEERLYIQLASKIEGKKRGEKTFKDVLDNLDYYADVGDISSGDANIVTTKVSKVLSIITSLGMIVAVLMLAILGVKYMLSSVEEKAEYKKDMIPYLIGAILLFGIATIVKVLQQLGQSINNI